MVSGYYMAYTLYLDHVAQPACRPIELAAPRNDLVRISLDCHYGFGDLPAALKHPSSGYPPFLEPVPVSVMDIGLSDSAPWCCLLPGAESTGFASAAKLAAQFGIRPWHRSDRGRCLSTSAPENRCEALQAAFNGSARTWPRQRNPAATFANVLFDPRPEALQVLAPRCIVSRPTMRISTLNTPIMIGAQPLVTSCRLSTADGAR